MNSWTEIRKIANPTEAEQLEAVRLNWYAISFIENPTVAVQKEAFAKNIQTILYVKNGLCEELKSALNSLDEASLLNALKNEPNILKFITNTELLKAIIKSDWKIIRKIDNANDELWAEAVKVNAEALKFVPVMSEKVLIAAVDCNWNFLQEIERPSATVVAHAVKQDYRAFEFVSIKHRTEAVQLAAVHTDPRCIQYLQRASEAVQLAAVHTDKNVFSLIKNPCEAVKAFCAG